MLPVFVCMRRMSARLNALFEGPSVLGAGHKTSHVKGDDSHATHAGGRSLCKVECDSLNNCRLPDAATNTSAGQAVVGPYMSE